MISEREEGYGPIPNSILVFALIIVVSIGAIYTYSEIINDTSDTGEDYEKFASENYGFSFSYPSNWIVENQRNPYTGSLMVMGRENVTENALQSKAGFRIDAGSLGIGSIENVENRLLSQIENNENLSIVEGPNDASRGGLNGLELTLTMEIERGRFESRYLLLSGEKTQYWINSYLQENSYEDFEDEIKNIFESFTIMEQ